MFFKLKSFLKIIFCHFIYYTGILHVWIRFVFLRQENYPAVIINYHRFVTNMQSVLDIEPTVTHHLNDFKKEILFLKRYFDIVALDAAVDKLKKNEHFSRPTVAITVDDGFKDNYELLFPILKQANIPATIFLTTGVIGTNGRIWVNHLADMILNTQEMTLHMNGIFSDKTFHLDSLENKRLAYIEIMRKLKDMETNNRNQYLLAIETQLGKPQNGQPLMLNWDEVRAMYSYNISFGAHTVNHPILTNMPIADAKKEVEDSKRKIEHELGVAVKHFAYPNGRPQDFNDNLLKFCKELGFESVSTCDYGNNSTPADIWALRRIGSCVPISLFAFNVIRSFLVHEKKI